MSSSSSSSAVPTQTTRLHVGICGAGLGGLLAAIAIANAGAQVTVLEQASQLGEIGAGIQMTPNVASLLEKYGIDKVIGENLVRYDRLNLRRKDGTKVGTAPIIRIEEALGHPWWLVHRHDLHTGLVEVARRQGCLLVVNSRVSKVNHQSGPRVQVSTEAGKHYTFDLLIGADGVGSIVRSTLFPHVRPCPPTDNCAYRAIVPYAEIRKHADLVELVRRPTMEVWMAPKAYIISYPISAGKDFNMVLSHHVGRKVSRVEEIDIQDLHASFADFDPRIAKIVKMIPHAQRWPLLVTGPLDSWSSPRKNAVLMGDAAHSMVNHMAQGAATSMEDGAFLGVVIGHVVRGDMSLAQAVSIYEKARMPLADLKQQVSFLNGVMWMLPDGPEQKGRDKAMEPELRDEPLLRSPNLYSDPQTVLEVYGYDAEAHAEEEVRKWLSGCKATRDGTSRVTETEKKRVMGWFLQSDKQGLRLRL